MLFYCVVRHANIIVSSSTVTDARFSHRSIVIQCYFVYRLVPRIASLYNSGQITSTPPWNVIHLPLPYHVSAFSYQDSIKQLASMINDLIDVSKFIQTHIN